MTITTVKNRINQVADGIQTVFPYDFLIASLVSANVYLDGDLQISGFVVNGIGNQAGGDVTFAVPPLNLVIVTTQRLVPETQEVNYLPYDPFPAETHEDALDKLTMITQQNRDQNSRAITAPITDDGNTDYTLPPYDAGKGIMYSENNPQRIVTSDDNFNQLVNDATAQANAASASAGAASASAGAASTSAGAALASENNAGASETRANEWAENPEDTEVVPGGYSALHWARKSQSAAQHLPGFVAMFGGVNLPGGWLRCNGAAISRTVYALLFAELGVMYGAGDGTTTFNLPLYSGLFPRAIDGGAGNDPDAATRTDRGDGTTGDAVGTKQADEFRSHLHDIPLASSASGSGAMAGSNPSGIWPTASTGGSETRPGNFYIDFIMYAGF